MPSRPAEAGRPSDARTGRSRDAVKGYRPCDPPQAASARAVENRRFGVPPGGLRGPPSSSHKASRIVSMLTGAFRPAGARRAGQEAIAEASEAQEARIARFSARVRSGCATTSWDARRRCPDAAAPGNRIRCRGWRSSAACVPPFDDEWGGSPTQRGRAAAGYSLKPPWLRADGRCCR